LNAEPVALAQALGQGDVDGRILIAAQAAWGRRDDEQRRGGAQPDGQRQYPGSPPVGGRNFAPGLNGDWLALLAVRRHPGKGGLGGASPPLPVEPG
jgi:hypothetical protein